ncbi:MAG: hypothetical protein ACK4ND_03365 [Cytophagaceae bacterium]
MVFADPVFQFYDIGLSVALWLFYYNGFGDVPCLALPGLFVLPSALHFPLARDSGGNCSRGVLFMASAIPTT